jgi:hypothetical protein
LFVPAGVRDAEEFEKRTQTRAEGTLPAAVMTFCSGYLSEAGLLSQRGVQSRRFLLRSWSELLKRDSFMMHTLRNRKRGRKSARWRFTEARRTSQTTVYPHLAGTIRHSNSISRPLRASEPDCDAHICLNLGFTSHNFRLTEVSAHVCYFWSSPFGMDEGDTVPSEQED